MLTIILRRLLLKMSARKIVDKRRHDQRQRRGAGAKIHSLDHDGDAGAIIQVIGDEPTPEMVLIMEESFERLLAHLGVGRLREIAGSPEEVAIPRDSHLVFTLEKEISIPAP